MRRTCRHSRRLQLPRCMTGMDWWPFVVMTAAHDYQHAYSNNSNKLSDLPFYGQRVLVAHSPLRTPKQGPSIETALMPGELAERFKSAQDTWQLQAEQVVLQSKLQPWSKPFPSQAGSAAA
jgi:hypothetical protein